MYTRSAADFIPLMFDSSLQLDDGVRYAVQNFGNLMEELYKDESDAKEDLAAESDENMDLNERLNKMCTPTFIADITQNLKIFKEMKLDVDFQFTTVDDAYHIDDLKIWTNQLPSKPNATPGSEFFRINDLQIRQVLPGEIHEDISVQKIVIEALQCKSYQIYIGKLEKMEKQ